MARKNIRSLVSRKVFLLDGALGTELIARGHGDILPERAVLEIPHVVEEIHKSYASAGSNILLTATLGANPIKLKEAALADKMAAINHKALSIARKAAGPDILIAGNLGPTGRLFPPSGTLSFTEAYECYCAQSRVLAENIDLFILETFFDIRELKAAVLACRDTAGSTFIIANLTFGKDGRTLTGTDPIGFALAFEDLDVDALGINCSLGPEEMVPIFQELARNTRKYLSAKPNAGIPKIIQGDPHYDMDPGSFTAFAEDFIELGAHFIGGCCGTGPEHIKSIADRFGKYKPRTREIVPLRGISSLSKNALLDPNTTPLIIGERINPTGKKKMTEDLQRGITGTILNEAKKQAEFGAQVLDLNIGMESSIEDGFICNLVSQLLALPGLPLALDMRSDHLIEAALQAYGGRALLNSITLLDMETKVKLLKRYGGMAVFLPLDKDGIPSTARKRALLASKAVKKLGALGFGRERILFDPIVMSLATGNDPQTTLHTLRLYKKKGYLTVMGLSNISYGLPHRPSINHYFLDLCTAIGLDAVIMDPSDKKGAPHIDLGAVFSGKQEIKDFIAQVAFPKEPAPIEKKEETELELLLHTMLEGEKEKVIEQIEALLRTRDYERIIEESLRPALDEIGKRYGRHEIFLPQLIMAAETAQAAFGYLQRRFSRKSAGEGKVIIATVKGDLHDIGKNIVAMMLRNGGFEVEDLGKDVPSEDIVQHALKKKADIIALSALMTTTAMKMKEVIALAKKSAVPAKVIIGGACITKKFAEEIGAHAYASDASGAVREVKRLLAKKP